MRHAQLAWYRMRWPREVELDNLRDAVQLLASAGGAPLVIEAVGHVGRVEHRLGLPARRASYVVEQLRSLTPELAFFSSTRDPVAATRTLNVRVTSRLRSLHVDHAELVGRAVLAALAGARRGETLMLQWQLVAALPAEPVGQADVAAEPLPASVVDVLLGRQGRLDAEGRQALRAKRALPAWRAVGRIAVAGVSDARARVLLHQVVVALRLANAPGVQVVAVRAASGSINRFGSWLAPLRLNAAEVVAVSGWPIGPTAGMPIDRAASRVLAPSEAVAGRGRVIAVSTSPGPERCVALRTQDALRHLHVLGPTGVGKSTLLLNLIAQDVAAGRGVVVVEPKGDLIAAVLERIPHERLDDVVLVDPSDEAPVGLNPLSARGRLAELVADELLGMFRRLYESSWGPRTNDILGASLLTLARAPGMTLCALPVLLTDPAFRHRLVSMLDDPVALEPFWMSFEAWSDAERTAAVAPSLNRIRPFLMRPQLRAVFGQATPRFDLGQVFRERKVLLVNLAKGAIGAEAASLLGSLVLSQLWAAAQRRTLIAAERRRPVFVYIDEFQDYLHLPTDLSEALAQARSLGVGFVLAHQHLSQLDAATRSAVLANARSRVCFQLAADDARALASGVLKADDLRELGAFEIYAQLVANGAVQPWCSGRTLPACDPIGIADQVRHRSRELYGVSRRVVDESITELLGGGRGVVDDLAPRRRGDRSGE